VNHMIFFRAPVFHVAKILREFPSRSLEPDDDEPWGRVKWEEGKESAPSHVAREGAKKGRFLRKLEFHTDMAFQYAVLLDKESESGYGIAIGFLFRRDFYRKKAWSYSACQSQATRGDRESRQP